MLGVAAAVVGLARPLLLLLPVLDVILSESRPMELVEKWGKMSHSLYKPHTLRSWSTVTLAGSMTSFLCLVR